MKLILGILALGLLSACSSQTNKNDTELSNTKTSNTCPEQRPQVCTMDYRPVCATRDTGVRCVTAPCPSSELKTFSNACTACADPKVISYTPDECGPAVKQ